MRFLKVNIPWFWWKTAEKEEYEDERCITLNKRLVVAKLVIGFYNNGYCQIVVREDLNRWLFSDKWSEFRNDLLANWKPGCWFCEIGETTPVTKTVTAQPSDTTTAAKTAEQAKPVKEDTMNLTAMSISELQNLIAEAQSVLEAKQALEAADAEVAALEAQLAAAKAKREAAAAKLGKTANVEAPAAPAAPVASVTVTVTPAPVVRPHSRPVDLCSDDEDGRYDDCPWDQDDEPVNPNRVIRKKAKPVVTTELPDWAKEF